MLCEALELDNIHIISANTKMGKSLGNAIYLSDSEEEINTKVMSALTDTSKIKKDDPANPEICMVGYYHNLFSQNDKEKIFEECRNGKRGCVACKKELAKNISEYLRPIREKRRYYEERPEIVEKILIEGTKKARAKAQETMQKVKEAMRIDYFKD
jgi:tryptophanyl-tRNA synthetase